MYARGAQPLSALLGNSGRDHSAGADVQVYKDEKIRDHLVKGLRKAGMPGDDRLLLRHLATERCHEQITRDTLSTLKFFVSRTDPSLHASTPTLAVCREVTADLVRFEPRLPPGAH
jgi:hypothetical protein